MVMLVSFVLFIRARYRNCPWNEWSEAIYTVKQRYPLIPPHASHPHRYPYFPPPTPPQKRPGWERQDLVSHLCWPGQSRGVGRKAAALHVPSPTLFFPLCTAGRGIGGYIVGSGVSRYMVGSRVSEYIVIFRYSWSSIVVLKVYKGSTTRKIIITGRKYPTGTEADMTVCS